MDTHTTLAMQGKRSPERRCLVTGEVCDKSLLLRFVVGPENRIVPDVAGKLPGRGLWMRPSGPLLKEAIEKKLFGKAAKHKVNASLELLPLTEELLYQRVIHSIGLARKSGAAIHGFDKVSAALSKGQVIALLHAADAGEDGIRKLKAQDNILVSRLLSRQDLSRFMGSENAVHVAILSSGSGENFLHDYRRFAGFVGETQI